jgi:hypothetical protein
MRVGRYFIKDLKGIGKGHLSVLLVAVSLQVTIVVAAAVAYAVPMLIKGKAGHEHKDLFIYGRRPVPLRFGDTECAGFYIAEGTYLVKLLEDVIKYRGKGSS